VGDARWGHRGQGQGPHAGAWLGARPGGHVVRLSPAACTRGTPLPSHVRPFVLRLRSSVSARAWLSRAPQTHWWAGSLSNVCHIARDRVITRIAGGRAAATAASVLQPGLIVVPDAALRLDEQSETKGFRAASEERDDHSVAPLDL
jgi:hypothetical protein